MSEKEFRKTLRRSFHFWYKTRIKGDPPVFVWDGWENAEVLEYFDKIALLGGIMPDLFFDEFEMRTQETMPVRNPSSIIHVDLSHLNK